jgi:formate/nitrite transporter
MAAVTPRRGDGTQGPERDGTAAPAFPAAGIDALPPAQMAAKAEDVGRAKAELATGPLLALGVLAGAFIALGAIFSTTVTAGTGDLPFGVVRLLAGLTFSLGLVLVVVCGAELFTGNNLIVMGWASRRVPTTLLLRNWVLVYAGNFVGAVATVAIVYVARQYRFGDGAVGEQALAIATAKTQLGFVQAIALGALCNALVCLAVWMTYSARSTTDRILSVMLPIAAFVAAGFEHSVANMYFIPMGLVLREDESWLASQGIEVDPGLTWQAFFVDNLLPVTIGNVIGGSLMVGAVYWLVYLRRRPIG